MKKVALFVIVMMATALAVSAVNVVWGLVEANDWINRCSDETSSTYIADDSAREEFCVRTVDSVSRDL